MNICIPTLLLLEIFIMRLFCIWGVILLIFSAPIDGVREQKTACEEKQRTLALLDVAEDSLAKAHYLYPGNTERGISSNMTDEEKRERGLAFLEITKNLISEVKDKFQACSKTLICPNRPRDCSEILANGNSESGVYTIFPVVGYSAEESMEVYCDMETDGGGWTVIQRRGNFSVQQDFNQGWESYRKGFGDLHRDFWLGNDKIFLLSNQEESEIRFDLQMEQERRYAVYKTFWIDDQYSSYKLHIDNYEGNAGDSMKLHNGFIFSTKDNGHMRWAAKSKGGWWYCNCNIAMANLNGVYQPHKLSVESVSWFDWLEMTGLTHTEMKLRPKESQKT
ncbi:techylectin-5A [Nephila pilipes]|uniref:Techylectin-5A n=1 Tax=Nephila pilipes TaxID=299642 RepID=A0A8X6PK15_NEPPI|nr:techylectin-5A [Nephila pilipes]